MGRALSIFGKFSRPLKRVRPLPARLFLSPDERELVEKALLEAQRLCSRGAGDSDFAKQVENVVRSYLDMQDARRRATPKQYRRGAKAIAEATRTLRRSVQEAPSEVRAEIGRRFHIKTGQNLLPTRGPGDRAALHDYLED